MTLAEYILSKLREGWPQNLTNWNKTYCQVPKKATIEQWITEWKETQ